ncbi:MAG: glycosyltransferase [bacterium]|nr:glycosyltransferase [bacterium]
MILTLLIAALVLAAVPAALFAVNVWFFRSPPDGPVAIERPQVSVLIPARNEAANIQAAVEAVAACENVDCEILILDDHSTDGTAAIISEMMAADSRIRLINGAPLPPDWCGKQFANQQLGDAASHELLLFIDADVRLAPSAIERSVAYLQSRRADMVSGFPNQVTETFGEQLLIPLFHFVLLGFLPLPAMRWSRSAAFGAACGQFILLRKEAWVAAGGHAAIRSSLHDGLQLPRTFRRNGFITDFFNANDIAQCRMYTSFGDTVVGLKKNALEGLASAGNILPFSLLLIGGQVLPALLLLVFMLGQLTGVTDIGAAEWSLALTATSISYLPRLATAIWFRQSWLGAIFHPVGVAVLVAIQWWAFGESLIGRKAVWKGRAYGPV